MLTKDTMQFLSLRIARRLARSASAGLQYQVRIPSDKLDLLVGARLDNRYYVLSLLGKGGMSLVYKAKDLKTGEIVAVKSLRTQVLSDETLVKRFKREADVLQRLNHPRIVQFFAHGTSKGGLPYFVMDYLVGKSLGTILRKEGPLDLGRFQDIFVQVAAAIGHAHKHGAIHRDIKPGNIMLVEKSGTSDYVKIVDFGIAKVAEGTQRLTRLGEVWGSPIYMSPEQCMGTNVDARTDIYSLGIVMYEALTGEVPFLGRNYADTMTKQISEEPPPFKTIAAQRKIPESLEAIVFKAIRKKPPERYQSMADLKHDLERALDARSIDLKSSGRSFIKTRSDSGEQHLPVAQGHAMDVTSDKLQTVPLASRLDVTSDKLTIPTGTSLSLGSESTDTVQPKPDANATHDFSPEQASDHEHSYFGKPIELTGPNVISASPQSGSSQSTVSAKGKQASETESAPRAERGKSARQEDYSSAKNAMHVSDSQSAKATPEIKLSYSRGAAGQGTTGSGSSERSGRQRIVDGRKTDSNGDIKSENLDNSQARRRRPTSGRNRTLNRATPVESSEADRASRAARHTTGGGREQDGTKPGNKVPWKLIIAVLLISLLAGMVGLGVVDAGNIKQWLLNNVYVSNDEQH